MCQIQLYIFMIFFFTFFRLLWLLFQSADLFLLLIICSFIYVLFVQFCLPWFTLTFVGLLLRVQIFGAMSYTAVILMQ